jgi:hypothetical protein
LPSRRSRLRSRLMRPQEPRNRKIDEHGTDRYLLGRSAAFTRERRLPRAPRLRATPFSSTSTSSPLGQPPRHANRRLLTWSASPVRLSCAAGRDRPSQVKPQGPALAEVALRTGKRVAGQRSESSRSSSSQATPCGVSAHAPSVNRTARPSSASDRRLSGVRISPRPRPIASSISATGTPTFGCPPDPRHSASRTWTRSRRLTDRSSQTAPRTASGGLAATASPLDHADDEH